MNHIALNAFIGMVRILMLLFMLGPWAHATRAGMRPDCPMLATVSSMPCPSLDERTREDPGCVQTAMNAPAPCAARAQRTPSKQPLPSAAVPDWFVPATQIAALARPPKIIDVVAREIRSRRRNASLAVRYCSFLL